MIAFIRVTVVLSLLLVAPTVADGQAMGADTVYIGDTRSALASGLIELFLPTAGYAYAGDWTRGFLPNAFRIASYIGYDRTHDGLRGCVRECRAWMIGGLVTVGWGVVGSVRTANDRNARIHEQRSSLSVHPTPDGGVWVSMRIWR